MIKRLICLVVAFHLAPSMVAAQPPSAEARIEQLEAQLQSAQASLASLAVTVESLRAQVEQLRSPADVEAPVPAIGPGDATARATEPVFTAHRDYQDRILSPDLEADERGAKLEPRPELFVQTRYHANPIDEAGADDTARNFGLNRVELRWSGRVTDRIGMGYEIQYHPAPDGAVEELINDAFVEYYPHAALTIRAGQFVKPFGFDIQHSSADRESPERGMFAGYLFPGQRDRGLMLTADLGRVVSWGSGVLVQAGILNGNRFFDDNNDALNYNLRLRKFFDALPLAIGLSVQRGTQILPPGVGGDDDENLYGFDAQYVIGRLGIRAEYVRGNMPSTLLGLEPEFAPGFLPGAESKGMAAFFNYNLSAVDDVYWRWDRFENDPVTRANVRSFNLGYLRRIGTNSRIGVDYQRKNHVTFNDDELNNAFSVTWNVEY